MNDEYVNMKPFEEEVSAPKHIAYSFIVICLWSIIVSVMVINRQGGAQSMQPTGYKASRRLKPLTYLSVSGDKIRNERGEFVNLRGFHFEFFYVLPKLAKGPCGSEDY